MRQRVVSLGADREKVHVIPMGVDLKNTFIPPGTARREKSLLFVGRFVEKKGLRYLIEALSLVLLKHPQAHLSIVGHGPEETDLKQLLSSLHLNEKVNFLGGIENSSLPSIYQSAEIVIFPSIIDAKGDMEGFGLVIVEALGCECAVIASDLPAIHDIIIDNKTGLIVEQKNVQQIAHKIIYLLDHPDIKHSLGKEGRRYVLDRYDYEITARKYCDLFKELENRQ
jgi:glycosyltransferase involved in cell wall biosynthesis